MWTGVLSVVIGLIPASAILVYAQELIPSRAGMISGLFFGLAFGMGGIECVYRLCAHLQLMGLVSLISSVWRSTISGLPLPPPFLQLYCYVDHIC
jgi:hypothetical protein